MISRLAEIKTKHSIHHGICVGILARVLWTPLAFDMKVNVALYSRAMVNHSPSIQLMPHLPLSNPIEH
jgi:hypothetical protein